MWRQGEISADSAYWFEGAPDWQPILKLRSLLEQSPQQTKPVVATSVPTRLRSARPQETDKRILVAFLLCFFLGYLGIHRFYVGKIGSGFIFILLLVTAFLVIPGIILIIWLLIDLILILIGGFKDSEGRYITKWT